MCRIERNGKSELKQKLSTLASWDNGIKMVVGVAFKYNFSEKVEKLRRTICPGVCAEKFVSLITSVELLLVPRFLEKM